MKILFFVCALSLVAVGCQKKEETAPAVEGHDVEHSHVTEGADHAHDDAHHGDHDHAAHHPEHAAE